MLSRLMAPAVNRMAAIDLQKFIVSIICAEIAMNNTINALKNEIFFKKNGGVG